MIRRWRESRTFRKLIRNRMAIAALLVIGLFFLTAIAVAFFPRFDTEGKLQLGLITLEDTKAYVGPANVPGFGLATRPDQRVNDASQILEQIERALNKDDFRANLDNIEFGQLKIADLGRDELTSRVDRAWAIYDDLSEFETLDKSPELLPEIENLDSIIYTELYEPPSGMAAWLRKVEMCWGTDRQGRSIFLRDLFN